MLYMSCLFLGNLIVAELACLFLVLIDCYDCILIVCVMLVLGLRRAAFRRCVVRAGISFQEGYFDEGLGQILWTAQT